MFAPWTIVADGLCFSCYPRLRTHAMRLFVIAFKVYLAPTVLLFPWQVNGISIYCRRLYSVE